VKKRGRGVLNQHGLTPLMAALKNKEKTSGNLEVEEERGGS